LRHAAYERSVQAPLSSGVLHVGCVPTYNCVSALQNLSMAMASPETTPNKGAAQRQFYRKRFESSVFGEHPMLPPTEVSERFLSKEEPSKYPTGQDSSFMHMTPMPFRFTEQYVEERKAALSISPKKKLLPYYQTSSSDVGKLAIEPTDLPMRWYGIRGGFTSSWVAESKTMTNSGLSTSIFRSNVHPT
jgi:hypothetical protein